MIRAVGGRRVLVEEAKELEKAGLVQVEWKDMGADIKCLGIPSCLRKNISGES